MSKILPFGFEKLGLNLVLLGRQVLNVLAVLLGLQVGNTLVKRFAKQSPELGGLSLYQYPFFVFCIGGNHGVGAGNAVDCCLFASTLLLPGIEKAGATGGGNRSTRFLLINIRFLCAR